MFPKDQNLALKAKGALKIVFECILSTVCMTTFIKTAMALANTVGSSPGFDFKGILNIDLIL